MNKAVFDASAVLVVYYDEPGKKRVLQLLDRTDPVISAPNLSEAFTKLFEDGLSESEIVESFDGLGIEIVDFDRKLATKTAELRLLTKHLGLSLGDRACLALAIQNDAVAVSADRSWAELGFCKVEIIR